jgi:hypothetical protein
MKSVTHLLDEYKILNSELTGAILNPLPRFRPPGRIAKEFTMAPAPEPNNDNSAANSIYDLVYRLIIGCPVWVRILTVLVLAGALALSLLGKIPSPFGKAKKQAPTEVPSTNLPAVAQTGAVTIQIQNGPYSLPAGSKQIDAPGNANQAPENIDATHHVDEDARHYKYHQDHPEDDPELNMIAKMDDKNDISYKFYSKTDKCVWVLRHENGVPISQFVKDPAYRDGVAQPPHAANQRSSPDSENVPATASLIDALVPLAQLRLPGDGDESHLQPVQAGCANPHPGPFSWWWGPPQDQCWSPMYRRWKDGCTHYQLFNRCANAWDGRIIWTFCNPNHSW